MEGRAQVETTVILTSHVLVWGNRLLLRLFINCGRSVKASCVPKDGLLNPFEP